MGSEAWQHAYDAADAAGVTLRPLEDLEDADRILDVMIDTWGEHQLLPRELIRALQHSGNAPYGAFAAGELRGYVLGFLARDADGPHVHSHMLAVRPGGRSKGVGYALKLAQRAQALDAGVSVVRWTYDPLLARNAHFNLGKLRAYADGFERDFYGEMDDQLNRGDRSDRFSVRWDLDGTSSPGRLVNGSSLPVLRRSGDDPPHPERIADPHVDAHQAGAIIGIPEDYPAIRQADPGLARAWRDAVADAFEACFTAGMVGGEFERFSCSYYFAAVPGFRPRSSG
ncbi:MAG TPA: GNAT family N-acetyltransferase [Actinomycetota bacterium]|jgi:predicted GNAT superfamily acetyltransferase